MKREFRVLLCCIAIAGSTKAQPLEAGFRNPPVGPVPFAGPQWREMFKHVVAEAHRLGLQVNMNNDAGWCGSGGAWVPPDKAMQKLVWTETQVTGPTHVDRVLLDRVLPQPQVIAGYYRDVAVLAFPAPAADNRIPDIAGKTALIRQEFLLPASLPEQDASAAIRR